MKRALLIGIDDYPGNTRDMETCVNDVERWENLLRNNYLFTERNIHLLKDEDIPDRTMVLEELSWLSHGTSADDVLVFVFAGHGTRRKLREGERWVWHEGICLYGPQGNEGYLFDKDLQDALAPAHADANITIICDACHSGGLAKALSASDDEYEAEIQRFGWCYSTERSDRKTTTTHDFSCHGERYAQPKPGVRSMLLAATFANQEAYPGGQSTDNSGVFTYYAVQTIREAEYQIAPCKLIHETSAKMLDAGYDDQEPTLSGRADLFDRPLFS